MDNEKDCLDPEPSGFIGCSRMEAMIGLNLEYNSSQQFKERCWLQCVIVSSNWSILQFIQWGAEPII